MSLLTTPHQAELAGRAPGRRLAPGIGLMIGAAVSLALWVGLAYGAVSLLG
ncbi:MAG TPA: hypothetical protein VJU34_11065 [Phenylobacterium sp.]|nr:hypothetical protein [Phenylobacterium sp.]